MNKNIPSEDVVRLRDCYNKYISKLAAEVYYLRKGKLDFANDIDTTDERKDLSIILEKIFTTK